jgi:hypothetical protein
MADRAKPAAAASPTASESPVAGGRGQRRKGPDRTAQRRYRAVCWLIGGSGPIEPCHQILQGAVAAAVAGGAAGLLAGMDLVGPDLDDDTVRIAGHLAGSCPAQSDPSVRLDRPECRSSPTRRTAGVCAFSLTFPTLSVTTSVGANPVADRVEAVRHDRLEAPSGEAPPQLPDGTAAGD